MSTDTRSLTIADHAATLLGLLRTEWEAPGMVRAWHARFRSTNAIAAREWVDVAIIQRKYQDGFIVARTSQYSHDTQTSHAGFTTASAAIWLGLEEITTPLEWRIEL